MTSPPGILPARDTWTADFGTPEPESRDTRGAVGVAELSEVGCATNQSWLV